MGTQELERRVRRVRRRAAVALGLAQTARWVAAGLLALGTLALLARAGLGWERAQVVWLFAPLAALPFVAWRLALRRAPADGDAAAWLDLRARASGLLLTLRERPDERWGERAAKALAALPAPSPLGVGRALPRALGAAAFAAAALFVPLPRSQAAVPPTFFERLAGELMERVSTLSERAALEPELADELLERAQNLAELAARTTDGEGFLEAFDALEARADDLAAAAGAELLQADGALGQLAQAALEDPGAALQQLARAQQLLKALEASGALPPELRRALEGLRAAAGEGGSIDPSELMQLAQRFATQAPGLRESLRERLEALREAGLLRESKCEGGAECANGRCQGGASCTGAGQRAAGGTEGGGEAPLWWSEELRELTGRLASKTLPPGAREDLEHSTPIGTSLGAPDVQPLPEAAGGDVQGSGEQRAAWRRELAPRHRAAVREFFQPSPRAPK